MVHHPEGNFGNAGGKLSQLDAVELVHIDLAHLRHVQRQLSIVTQRMQEGEFEKP